MNNSLKEYINERAIDAAITTCIDHNSSLEETKKVIDDVLAGNTEGSFSSVEALMQDLYADD